MAHVFSGSLHVALFCRCCSVVCFLSLSSIFPTCDIIFGVSFIFFIHSTIFSDTMKNNHINGASILIEEDVNGSNKSRARAFLPKSQAEVVHGKHLDLQIVET